MKKLYIVLIFSLAGYSLLGQANVSVGATYGSDFDQWGGRVQAGYQFKYWGVRAAYTSFFKNQISMKPSAVSVDFNYEIPTKLILVPYVLVGINLLKTEIQESEDLISYGTYGGVSLGLGVLLDINDVRPFSEFKYVTGNTGQWFVSAGINYRLPW